MEQTPTIPQPPQDSPYMSPTPPEPQKKREEWRSIVSTILILISAPLIALTITSFVFQSYEVDGPSMETTLQNQDRLIVLKLPRTISKITRHPYIPTRGEIIVFARKGMDELEQPNERQLIKRVIGLPGDRVVIENGSVLIYNSEHPEGYNPDVGVEYPAINESTPGNVDLHVDEGEIFVMGDNRSNSLDSRSFGTIASDEIVGKLVLRILPLNKAKTY
jgi:signal peptidase I